MKYLPVIKFIFNYLFSLIVTYLTFWLFLGDINFKNWGGFKFILFINPVLSIIMYKLFTKWKQT